MVPNVKVVLSLAGKVTCTTLIPAPFIKQTLPLSETGFVKSAQKPEVPCAFTEFEAFPFHAGDFLLFLMWLVCGSEMVAVMKMLIC